MDHAYTLYLFTERGIMKKRLLLVLSLVSLSLLGMTNQRTQRIEISAHIKHANEGSVVVNDKTYSKLSGIEGLVEGDYVIAYDTNYLSNFSSNIFSSTTSSSSALVVTLTSVDDLWTISYVNNQTTYYFSYSGSGSGSGNNIQQVTSVSGANQKWSISFDEKKGLFTINNASETGRYLQYNSGSPRFACYTGTQKNLDLYLESSTPSISIEESTNKTQGKVGEQFQFTKAASNIDPLASFEWVSTNTSAATIDEFGLLTLVGIGTTDIKCISGTTASNSYSFKSYPNDANDITIAEAIQVCELTGNTESPYEYSTSGIVSNIDNENNKITIKDENDENTTIECYGLVNYSSLSLNQKIRVTGLLKTYYSKPQFCAGSTYKTYNTVLLDPNNGDELIEYNDVLSGSKISEPTTPVKAGYTFMGWFDENENEWDFLNDVVTEDLILTAKWVDETRIDAQNDLNDIKPYFSLAYKYSGSSTAVDNKVLSINNEGAPADSSELNATTFWETSFKNSGKTYNHSISKPDGITVSELSKVFSSKNNSIKLGTSSAIGKFKLTDSIYKIKSVVINAKNYGSKDSQLIVNNGEAQTLGESANNFTFNLSEPSKSVEIATVGTDEKRAYIYGITLIFEDTIQYNDVDVRLKVAVDDMSSYASNYDLVQDYGIEVSTSTKTKKYSYLDLKSETKEAKDYEYQVISLGDVINNPSRLTEEFTIRSYAIYEYELNKTETLYSTTIKTRSVVDLVKAYYADAETTDIITPFYNLLVSMGKITA